MNQQRVIIEIPNKKQNRKIGRIIISATLNEEKKFEDFVTRYMNFSNVPKVKEPDNNTPIQYNEKNPVDPGARIMLLEETQYQMRFESYGKNNAKPILPTIYREEQKDSLVFEEWRIQAETDNNSSLQGTLNFHSYVGKSFFNVKIGELESGSIPFEVRSRKIGYRDQYPAMISDLSEASSSLILESKAPLYQRYDFSDRERRSYYEDFMFVEYLFKSSNLPEAYEYIRKNVYNLLEQKNREVSTCFASNFGPQELIDIAAQPSNLYHLEDSPSHWPEEMKNFFPLKITQRIYQETVDTPENRLVKHFLYSLESLLVDIKKHSPQGYIIDRIKEFTSILNDYLSDDWLQDVNSLRYIPSNSQVLQKREGYRSVFQFFLNFEFSFHFEWAEINYLIQGYNRRLSELYEYWCYFKIINVLSNLSRENINIEQIFERRGGKKWSLKIRRGKSSGKKFSLSLNGQIIFLTLWYNKRFSRRTKENPSYSLPFKPDYSLLVQTSNKEFFIHFDAKYRSEVDILNFYEKIGNQPINTKEYFGSQSKDEIEEKRIIDRDNSEATTRTYKDGDIYKMHTYKDAILKSEGAYILYPGDKQALFKVSDYHQIPSVGAFPLTPGKNGNDENELEEFLIAVLKKYT